MIMFALTNQSALSMLLPQGSTLRQWVLRGLPRRQRAVLATRRAISLLCGYRFTACVVSVAMRQDRPSDARQLVGQRDNGDILVRPRHQMNQATR
jgi:hypothetical protein